MGAPSNTRSSLTQRQRPSAAQLREARRVVLDAGGRVDVPLHQLDPRLTRSWLRSSRGGLTPEGRSGGVPHASAAQLARALDQKREFVAHAGPVMEYLFEQTRDSGSMVVLADARGMLLHALGDTSFLDRAERVALRPGAVWHEQVRGTNAIGTALADQAATVIHGAEHFLDRNGFLTCAAAPILDPSGQLVGVLDISGDHRSAHPHTFGLARAGARMIEQRLFDTVHHAALRLRFHRHAEGIGTLTEGLLAVSPDGWVLGANAVALDWLGLRASQLHGVQLDAVFEIERLDWLPWLQQADRRPRPLTSHHHGPVWARLDPAAASLDGSVPRLHTLGTDQPPAPTTGPAALPPALVLGEVVSGAAVEAPPSDALAALDHGDAVLRRAIDRARRLRDRGIPLLLLGESGAGKESFARAWHASSERRHARFVQLRCAGLVEGAFAAELHAALAQAEGGTLLLDEVGELGASDQLALLHQLTPEAGPGPTFALACSSRRSLADAVQAGTFHAELYYRLNGLLLQLPPLRERQDLAALALAMLAEFAPDRPLRLSEALQQALPQGRWRGNLRQLANALRTAVHLLDGDADCIDWPQLPDDLVAELRGEVRGEPLGKTIPARAVDAPTLAAGAPDALDAVAARTIERVITQCGGNLSEAARRLGISRNTLYRHLRRQG
ncbi:MAG TPA: sigma 54-interacting transcriptional regulator [Burkholderiaceae bacterium]|nr:sigma 54-interacting transcriptional regulator [Burkholderiaceae bacterium]HNG81278.1 sigma 54-interacting transcriptional regulator [Burkholderiaceae bacterium]